MRKLFLSCLLCFSLPLFAQQAGNKPFNITNKGTVASFGFYNSNQLRFLSLLPEGYTPSQKIEPLASTGHEVALHCTGQNKGKHVGEPGTRLRFIGKEQKKIPGGRQLTITQADSALKLKVESVYEFNDSSPVIRRYTRVTNHGQTPVGIENLSSAMLYNYNSITPGNINDNIKVSYAHNSYLSEGQWKTYRPYEAGMDETTFESFNTDITINSLGTRSTGKYLPMGMIENTTVGITWFWQIEHNGSWGWKMSSPSPKTDFLYMGGPDEKLSHAWKNLQPGETYQTVPVGIGCVKGGLNEAVAALTAYRRSVLLRPHMDHNTNAVIFNDYMNCLWADPTTEKEVPLIDAAARLGVEYFCIDAGWYSEVGEKWASTVGKWEPSKSRFKGGLDSLIRYIKSKGMKPGLWLEIEVAGINSPLNTKPDSWFLMRRGKRVIDGGRYLLDFRNPEVRAFATSVIDRLIRDFGIKYFKVDYNSGETLGTDLNADSFGQGLLEHNRAIIDWYKDIYKKYPDLIIEACASGGARSDYAMLSQNQLVSFSDQSVYTKNPTIIVGQLAAILPEQMGVWAYPKIDGDAKSASFNMVNAMFCRMYLSGLLPQISAESMEQVSTGVKLYKKVFAPIISQSVPFFPLGMGSMTELEKPVALGLRGAGKTYIAVWHMKGDKTVSVPLHDGNAVKLVYPLNLGIQASSSGKNLNVTFPADNMAVIVEITK